MAETISTKKHNAEIKGESMIDKNPEMKAEEKKKEEESKKGEQQAAAGLSALFG